MLFIGHVIIYCLSSAVLGVSLMWRCRRKGPHVHSVKPRGLPGFLFFGGGVIFHCLFLVEILPKELVFCFKKKTSASRMTNGDRCLTAVSQRPQGLGRTV